MNEINKFNEAEMLIGGGFMLIVDGVCFLLEFIPIIGAVMVFITQNFVTFVVIDMWVKSKGGKADISLGKQIGKMFSNIIPFANLVQFIVAVMGHNNPKLGAIAGAVGGSPKSAAMIK